SALRYRVLAWKQAVIRLEAQCVMPLHRSRQDSARELSGQCGLYRTGEEYPDMTSISRARAFKGGRHAGLVTYLQEGAQRLMGVPLRHDSTTGVQRLEDRPQGLRQFGFQNLITVHESNLG